MVTPRTPRSINAFAWLAVVIADGLLLRLTLSPFGGFADDLDAFREWATRLATLPLSAFYRAQPPADHLPGDMWILWVLAEVYHHLSPAMNVQGTAFLFLLKLVPALADTGVAVLLYLLARRYRGPTAGLLAAGLYLLTPAPLFLTAIWGQWDAVSGAPVLLALWLYLRGNPEWSLPALTYAALVKPNLATLVPVFVLAFLVQYVLPHCRRFGGVAPDTPPEALAVSVRRASVAVAVSLLLALALLLPFGVGIPPFPHSSSLLARLGYAANLYPFITLSAFNFWSFFGTPLSRAYQPDKAAFVLGLSYQVCGAGLFAIGYLGVLIASLRWWRRDGARTLLWTALAVLFVAFMLPTRVHERYLFPVVMLAALFAATEPHLRWFFAALSLTYLVNLFWVYDRRYEVLRLPFVYSAPLFVFIVAAVNVALLLYALFVGFAPPAVAARETTTDAGGRTAPAR